jgi:LysM domain
MNLLLLFLAISPIQTQADTVPGTYPPVPKKYWVPVAKPTPSATKPTGRRLSLSNKDVKGENSNTPMDADPSMDSGIVKMMGHRSKHVVKSGETLWNISKKYFGNSWFWPKLWAWNTHITNPHWLFPGTTVWLTDSSWARKSITPSSSSSSFYGLNYTKNQITIRRKAFIEEKDLKTSSPITGSVEEKTMLSPGDTIYLKQPSGDDKFLVGNRYMVYRSLKKILYHPTKKEKIKGKKKKKKIVVGRVVRVLGEVLIKGIRKNKIVRASIVSSLYTIKRGDMVGTMVHRFANVIPNYNRTNKRVIGKIIHSVEEREMLSPGNLVITSIGKKHGIVKGSVFQVLVRGDGLLANLHPIDPSTKSTKSYPYETKGELIVFYISEHYSLAIVGKIIKPIKLKDSILFGSYPDTIEKE